MPFPPVPAVVIRMDGRMYILNEGAQHSAFVVSNRYRHRHGIGAYPFAVNLRMLGEVLHVDLVTAVRIARWLYPDGCTTPRDRIIRRLDSQEQSAWWVLCRQTAPALPSVERFLTACDALADQQRRFRAEGRARDVGGDAPGAASLAAKRAAVARLLGREPVAADGCSRL